MTDHPNPTPRSWDFRVLRTNIPPAAPGTEPTSRHQIIEVFYDDDGNIVAWGEAHPPEGETPRELRRDLAKRIVATFGAPALTLDDLP